jgi:tyrosinase
MTSEQRQRFIRALIVLKGSGVIDRFADVHVLQDPNIHRNSHFLPWHREFILRFEQELQRVDPRVSLPYWDSTIDRSPADPLWRPDFLGQFNDIWNLRRIFNLRISLPTGEQVLANQQRADYASFWPELERNMHDWPHVWVGGIMGGRSSPGDPAFFLHHAWIDLLWAQWQRLHPNAPFQGQAGFGLDDALAGWPDRTPANVLNHNALGYKYDVDPNPAADIVPRTRASSERCIGAVSRRQDHMELFWVAPDGSAKHAWYYDGQRPQPGKTTPWWIDEVAPGGSASKRTGIAAVSRRPDTMEIWWAGGVGGLGMNGAFYYDGMADWATQGINTGNIPALNGGLSSVSRASEHMEVFWGNGQGQLFNSFWYENEHPQPVWRTHQIEVSLGAIFDDTAVAAVSRAKNHMEVFYLTPQGAVKHAWYYDGQAPPWHTGTIAPAGASASLRSGIGVISRSDNHMEIFWVSPDGAVKHAWFYDGQQPPPGSTVPWWIGEIAPPGSASPRSGVAAVSRRPDAMELFWASPNGAMKHAWYYDGQQPAPGSPTPWWNGELAPPGSAAVGTGIAAISRRGDHMEVFWVAPNGAVRHAFYYDDQDPDWWGLGEIAPAGAAALPPADL